MTSDSKVISDSGVISDSKVISDSGVGNVGQTAVSLFRHMFRCIFAWHFW